MNGTDPRSIAETLVGELGAAELIDVAQHHLRQRVQGIAVIQNDSINLTWKPFHLGLGLPSVAESDWGYHCCNQSFLSAGTQFWHL